MPFCPSCGSQISEGIRFCPSCGSQTSVPANGAPNVTRATSSPGVIRTPPPGKPQIASTLSANYLTSSGASAAIGSQSTTPIIEDLKRLYRTKILPLESTYKFEDFHSPSLTDVDFDAKPMVLLVGQYSTGKTTFIKYLLERDFPGAHIGPEPTTDRFVAVMHGKDERIIPGNALAADSSKPFTALNKFGMAFLNKFECSQCDSPILDKISFIDSPGVLSGEKQRIGRAYSFPDVVTWFAERADRILLLFDANKLDISDEFKTAIECLRGHDDKIRVVLNKADIEIQHLMRVYGALMWSLGKVIKAPEVPRVYIGSFWDGPLQHLEMKHLLDAEMNDLLADLRALPRNGTVRKINELVKRCRMAKVHAHLISHMTKQFGMFGKKKLQAKLLDDLAIQFKTVQREANLPMGDFPNINRFKEQIQNYEIHKFPKLDARMMKQADDALQIDIPSLMQLLPGVEAEQKKQAQALRQSNGVAAEDNPFAADPDRAAVNIGWSVSRPLKNKYDNEFYALDLTADNKVSGANAKKVLLKSKLDPKLLKQVWDLSDIDKDGHLDHEEFAVAMHLIDEFNSGKMAQFPDVLPPDLIPPSYRKVPA